MKFKKYLAVTLNVAFITLTATTSLAEKYYLDLPSRLVVNTVQAPKNETAPYPETIWVRNYRANQMIADDVRTQVPVLPREKKDLVPVVEEYQGTHSGHMVKLLDSSTNRISEAKVLWIFADNTMRVEFTYYGSTITTSAYDAPVSVLLDRQVSELNGLKVDDKVCAIAADKKIKAGQKLEVDGVWASGNVDVNKGPLNELAYSLGLARRHTTHITNLKSCE